jgi:hypothetical protein
MAMAGVVVLTKVVATRAGTSIQRMLVEVLAVDVFHLEAVVEALVQVEVASPATTTGQVSSRENQVARLGIEMILGEAISKKVVEVICPIFVVVPIQIIISEIPLVMLGIKAGGFIMATTICVLMDTMVVLRMEEVLLMGTMGVQIIIEPVVTQGLMSEEAVGWMMLFYIRQ